MNPKDILYSKSHEWIKDNGDGTVTVGITDHAQDSLGDIVFVELPEPGDKLAAEEEFGVVESVKAASDLYMPVSGSIVSINEDLEDSPETVNDDPYGNGWMIKVELDDKAELENLLNSEDYDAFVESEE